VRFAHAAKIRASPLQCATRHKLGTRKCKAPAGRQISWLSERAALFARSSGNAAASARIYLSVRSAWTKRSLSRDARTLTRWPLGIRLRRRNLAALRQIFVLIRHVQFGQKADILRLSPNVRFLKRERVRHTLKISLQICLRGVPGRGPGHACWQAQHTFKISIQICKGGLRAVDVTNIILTRSTLDGRQPMCSNSSLALDSGYARIAATKAIMNRVQSFSPIVLIKACLDPAAQTGDAGGERGKKIQVIR